MLETDKNTLHSLFNAQKEAYIKHPYPSLTSRINAIKTIKKILLTHKNEILNALNDDFGFRDQNESIITEVLPSISNINYVLKHLPEWLEPEKRHVSLLHWPAKNYVFYQPKGIIGIIVPWNYPLILAIIPIVYALASGNSVMVKLSEYSKNLEHILIKLFSQYFAKEKLIFIEGGIETAKVFSQLPFDHLFFTGSTEVGKAVMRNAAENLTPVTLELGGKSPVIIAKNINNKQLKKAIKSILFAKYLNSGQTCIAPDYLYVPKEKLDEIISLFKASYQKFLNQGKNKEKITSLIHQKHYQRIQNLLYDEKINSDQIKTLSIENNKNSDNNLRQLELQLVINPNNNSQLMKEEIFGPILPILTYEHLDDVISYINQNNRPLSLYFYGDKKTFKHILKQTHAGGLCFNEALMQIAQDDLPFGGIGHSGMGNYHSKEGFISFSHQKAIHQKGKISFASLAYPPFGRFFHRLILKLFLR